MNTLNISNFNLNDITIDLKEAYKYITNNSVFLSHEQFVAKCEVITKSSIEPDYTEFLFINSDGKDYFVEGKDKCIYFMESKIDGSLIVTGPNYCSVARGGIGLGYAIRVGSGKGNAIRICRDIDYFNRINTYIGGAIRDGGGDGDSILDSYYIATCVRLGSGKGETYISELVGELYTGNYIYQQDKNDYGKLSIPNHLVSENENLLAKIISYEMFLEMSTYSDNTYWVEASNENIIVNDLLAGNDISIGMKGNLDGSIEVCMDNNTPHIIVTRAGLGNGSAIISGEGFGTCIRVGEGNGDAISIGNITGAARKIGKGKGTAYKENLLLGGISIVV